MKDFGLASAFRRMGQFSQLAVFSVVGVLFEAICILLIKYLSTSDCIVNALNSIQDSLGLVVPVAQLLDKY